VSPQPEPEVTAVEYGDSAIKYRLRFWLSDYGTHEKARDTVISNVWYALRRHSIDIPFPIRTVHVHQAAADPDLAEREKRLITELRRVDFLAELTDEELEILVPNTHVHQFGDGETLMHQGEVGDYFHILRRGKVKIVVNAGNGGGSIHIRDLDAPAFFGEISLLTGEARNASVIALSDVEVLELNREAFIHLFRARPDSLNQVSEVVARRISETRERVQAATATEDRRGSNWLMDKMRSIFGV
jgi:CRP-like cAMP-binding protein